MWLSRMQFTSRNLSPSSRGGGGGGKATPLLFCGGELLKRGFISPVSVAIRRPLVLFWFAVFAAASCSAATNPVPYRLFPVSSVTLSNGLQVLTLEDHNSPLVAVQLWYHVGSVNEPAGRHGFAHLFEHMMFRGTDRLGPTDHMDLIKSVGGTCNAFTDFDETCYHQTLPANQLELAFWLEAERMAFLSVDSEGFMTERKVVEEERRMNLNQPYGDLPDRALPLVFGQHPYAWSPIGTIRDLRQATPADVHAWWTTWYTPNNATLVVVGDVTTNRVRSLAERYFGWIPAVTRAPQKVPQPGPFPSPRQVELRLENAPAAGVGIGWRTVPEGHADGLALELLATILGGGESSRLYRRLVVQDRDAVVALAMHYGLRHAGGFGMGAALSPFGGDRGRALAALRSELDRLLTEGVSAQELEKARNQAQSKLLLEASNLDGKARSIGRAAVVGAGVEELNSRLERLRRLTPQDLARVARTYLDPQHALTLEIPASGLLDQLSRLLLGSRNAEEEAPIAPVGDARFGGRPGVVRPPTLPRKPPISESNFSFPQLAVQERRLTNGLRILAAPKPHTPTVHIILALPFGSWAEEKAGTAALALKLVSKATESHDEKALAEELERHGIHLAGTADQDESRIELTCLPEYAERALALLAEVAGRPTFPESAFKTSVNQALTELTMIDSEPRSVADREFRRHLFQGHPYARRPSGEAQDISALKPKDLAGFWKQVARPEKATLIVAGGLDPDRAFELGQQMFSSWRAEGPGVDAAAVPSGISKRVSPTQILLVDWPGAGQSEIRAGGFGIAYGDRDKPIADLTSSYFGGSFGSRLMKAIRVEKGGTYGAYGGFHEDRFAGTFRVSTFTRTTSTADTLRAVLAEIHALVDRPVSAEELALHRRYFLGNVSARFETPEQLAQQFARIALNGLPLDHVQRVFATIGSANPLECQRLVQRLVDPGHLLVVVVGDAARVRNALETIAPVTVLDRDGRPVVPGVSSPKPQ
jgi:zinc protease